MHKLINACLVMTVLISAYVLYSHEHATRQSERAIATLKKDIAAERERIKLLGAEWASLTRPDRLARLAAENLKLEPLKASQFAEEGQIAARIPPRIEVSASGEPKDAIADIIQEMQQ
jgi:cell division protein FtsL